jgi:hypothetical protein
MSYSQRLATIAVHASFNDSEFDMSKFLNRTQYFVGYDKEKLAYFARNREREKIKAEYEQLKIPEKYRQDNVRQN